MTSDFQVEGLNPKALFTLKLHRGEGMLLLGMDWRSGTPPDDFVGFAIEYREPDGDRFYALNNRIGFPDERGNVVPSSLTTIRSPIQKFRWVHFPRNADLNGKFEYRVTPVFMDTSDRLSYGDAQSAQIELARETYPGKMNVAFTRGFVSSQAFVDRYSQAGPLSSLLPEDTTAGLDFQPSHPQAPEALSWMGFEARKLILETLDQAIQDEAEVLVIAYDLNDPEVVTRLERLGSRLRVIIDDSDKHGLPDSAETQAAARLAETAGAANVKRQKMGSLQHNKTIVVEGSTVSKVVCGSTNFSWRGMYVQSNNAVMLEGRSSTQAFRSAFESYWQTDDPLVFGKAASAEWQDAGVPGVNAHVAFSPHASANALLAEIADDIENSESTLLYSLAFLYQTKGAIQNAIAKVTSEGNAFVCGISDKKVGGLEVMLPDGAVRPVYAAALSKNVPEPFRAEPAGGGGTRMHHKFVVIDFDRPTARVYMGSYNFSTAADRQNGEHLLVIRDRRVAVAYAVEALRIFDHYHFRVVQDAAKTGKRKLLLKKPPRTPGEVPWWREDFEVPAKIRDRKTFA